MHSEDDLRKTLAELVDSAAPDPAVVKSRIQLRNTVSEGQRRRPALVMLAVCVSIAVALVVAGVAVLGPMSDSSKRPAGNAGAAGHPSAGDQPPRGLDVRCEAATTVVSTKTVAAQRDGLHLRVTDRSGRSGTYLNFQSARGEQIGIGGGDPVSPGTSSRVLLVPPGTVSLNCAYDSGTVEATAVEVDVQDPGQYFRTTTLADLGCPPSGTSPTWASGAGVGKTPAAAIRALLAQVDRGEDLRARAAPIGYVGAASLTYLIEKDNRPWATAVVSPSRQQFSANMDQICG